MPGDIPHPSEHTSWPSWFYPPDTDEADPAALGRVFHTADDVPAGWAADWRAHGVNLNPAPKPAPAPGLSRAEIKAALTKRDIPFSDTDAKAVLQGLLDDAVSADELDESV